MLYRYLLCCICLAGAFQGSAQTAADYAVQLKVITYQLPAPQIRLLWKKPAGATGYTIYRKARTANSWQTLANLPATDSFYNDNNVVADSAYEYSVAGLGATFARGYIYAGIQAPAVHQRGALVLLVDSVFTDSCRAQILQLMKDLRGDGWAIYRHDVSRNASVPAIKNLIVSDYNNRPNVQSVLLLGHIPVPYSGDINPDGHPDHLGAWAADAYYADMNGTWTDNLVNDTAAARPQNRNKPGDGKWDPSNIPSDLELQLGRIDFANMPAFASSEVQLMRSYLSKDHRYKMDSITLMRKALVDDNFGAFSGEAFAANAWRSFPTLVGAENIFPLDFISTLKDSAYQWAYGCGGGSYTSAGGIGNTSNFTSNGVKGIFTLLFGSYFGDWDASNDFLRAPLCASDPALSCAWAGRPNWFMHPMGLGENLGSVTLLSQNNNTLYPPTGYGARSVHVALMGDPSLRTDYIKPPSNLVIATPANNGAVLTWTPSPASGVIGYYVYRCDSVFGAYQKISSLLTASAFSDLQGINGTRYYLVRPVVLQKGYSGGYYNAGVGIGDSARVTYPTGIASLHLQPEPLAVYPNPASTELHVFLELAASTDARLQVTDALGRLVQEEAFSLQKGPQTILLNVSGLSPGLYMVHLRSPGRHSVAKWVKVGDR